MATTTAVLQAAYDNYARLLLLCTEAIANPTRARVDAVLELADSARVMRPKLTYTAGNRTVDWTGYQTFLVNQMAQVQKLITQAAGPFEVNSRGRT